MTEKSIATVITGIRNIDNFVCDKLLYVENKLIQKICSAWPPIADGWPDDCEPYSEVPFGPHAPVTVSIGVPALEQITAKFIEQIRLDFSNTVGFSTDVMSYTPNALAVLLYGIESHATSNRDLTPGIQKLMTDAAFGYGRSGIMRQNTPPDPTVHMDDMEIVPPQDKGETEMIGLPLIEKVMRQRLEATGYDRFIPKLSQSLGPFGSARNIEHGPHRLPKISSQNRTFRNAFYVSVPKVLVEEIADKFASQLAEDEKNETAASPASLCSVNAVAALLYGLHYAGGLYTPMRKTVPMPDEQLRLTAEAEQGFFFRRQRHMDGDSLARAVAEQESNELIFLEARQYASGKLGIALQNLPGPKARALEEEKKRLPKDSDRAK